MTNRWDTIVQVVTKALTPRPGNLQETSRYSVDRSLRLIRYMEKIAATLPDEVRPEQLELGKVAALFCPLSNNTDISDATEFASDILQQHLAEPEIDTVLTILREYRVKNAKLAEARLLADAVALEDFGMVGFWNQTRSPQSAGKTLEQYIKMFRTQHDYGYWTSRLRDGFYYPASRRTATDRLANLAKVYQEIERQHLAEDIH